MRDIDLPECQQAKPKQFHDTDDEKLIQFAFAIQNLNQNPMALPCLVLMQTGVRSNELFALQFGDVQDGVLHIQRTADLVDGQVIPKRRTKSGTTKTRHVGLTDEVLSAIGNLKKNRNADKTDWIFPDPKGQPWKPFSFRLQWRRFLRLAGIEGENLRSVHFARHRVAHHLVEHIAEVNLADSALGHSPEMLLSTYSKTIGRPKRIAEVMSKRKP